MAASGMPSFFETLMAQSKVQANEFSFYLGHHSDGTANNSELVLGGQNPNKFTGTPTTFPVSSDIDWALELDAIQVNNGHSSVEYALLGDALLKAYYTIFSYDSADGKPGISFAKAI
ncbi:hypothetical protein EJ03DRAFT_373898 [Teratosphaeria nubilosa]|uniref:Peptidase A1 domain-containing protein n=1 Tax=Teratosphaeria nubilosa TaxID=161662 RepID=A0A6G1LD04_9PEZI|nr:hypothetical protein EJ03DRAFT_373898 [Teratosphaeria nubilosa]